MKSHILRILFFTGILAYSVYSTAQVNISGDLYDYVHNFISTIPAADTDEYAVPSIADMNAWENAMNFLLQEKYSDAHLAFQNIGYELIYFEDTITNSFHYVVNKTSSGINHWGLYVWNVRPCKSNLVLQSPHPKKDLNTGLQGIFNYLYTGAQAYMLSGVNRCNASAHSSCTGTTANCGTSEPYRVSDMAHNTNSIFQLVTILFLEHIYDPYFLQFHGFTKLSTDPYLIFSNSSTAMPPGEDFLLQLANALVAIDPVLDYKIAHIDLNWTRLRGLWNTQGREINGSSNACNVSSPGNVGRFFHLEQERIRLRSNQAGWQKMVDAINNVFINLDVDIDTIRQNVIASSDTINLKSFAILTGDSLLIESGIEINLEPGVELQSDCIEIRIK